MNIYMLLVMSLCVLNREREHRNCTVRPTREWSLLSCLGHHSIKSISIAYHLTKMPSRLWSSFATCSGILADVIVLQKNSLNIFLKMASLRKQKKEPMSNQDIAKLRMFMANQAITQFGAAGTIREVIEKYGLKKKVIKDILGAYKKYILKLEKELEEIPDQ
jgi:hypothetical protein